MHSREFPEISIQTHAFESLCGSPWREQQRDEFAIKLCRIARLRELTLLYAAASFARSVSLRLFFAYAKKSTHGIPDGLPSVALAKDGGGKANLTYDISTLKQVKLFLV